MCVGYDGKAVVSDIGIALQKGEVLTLIGSNGSGKSTVLKSIAGQLKLICGAVFLGDELFSEVRGNERARKMAAVFTGRIRAELMTCRDVVAAGRYPYTGRFGILSKADESVVDEAMELVRIADISNQDFLKTSDGQKQRVMLARAICQEPEILILDEPVSYLDIKYKLEFLAVLEEMRAKKGLTVIMSLHELELARRVSDKILCIKGGYVERCGTPVEIFKDGYIAWLFDIDGNGFKNSRGELMYIW